MNLDDTAKILLPILETLNHAQETNTEYDLDDKGLSVSKNIELKPGDPFYIAYDKETQRFNNTVCKYMPSYLCPIAHDLRC